MGYFSKRWEMAIMQFSGLAVSYTLRVNMSVAAQRMRTDLDWSEVQKGYVLSSFYWGYLVGQIPASIIAEHYGSKWLFGLSIAIPSLLTTLIPAASQVSLVAVILLRVAIGFFESSTFPAIYHFYPIWIPEPEKTFMIPFIVSGIYFGEIVGFSFSGLLVQSQLYAGGASLGGWQTVFYLFGLLGLLWFPVWMYVVCETPSSHPTITEEELKYILRSNDSYSVPDGASDKDVDDLTLPAPATGSPEMLSVTLSPLVLGEDIHIDDDETAAATRDHCTEAGSAPLSSREASAVKLDLMIDQIKKKLLLHRQKGRYRSIAQELDAEQGSRSDADTDRSTPRSIRTSDIDRRLQVLRGTPWRLFFTHPTAVCLLVAGFQYGWMNFTLTSEMPSYFSDVLGFNIMLSGVLCVFPYMALFGSALLFGRVFEHLQRSGAMSADTVRKAAQFIAYFCSGCTLVLCSFSNTDTMHSYGLMIATMLFFGANQCGMGCVFTDIAPVYSTVLNTVVNTMGALAGILGPIVVALLTEQFPGVAGWRAAFFGTFLMNCFSLVLWFVFVRAEIVPELNTPVSTADHS